ncbi:SprT-like family protein [Prosthecobacter fusiformis]|uniref:SprT-like family protein n=1 Tax=Prosthecobacter fusiformis TaxID=48464 RepID=A0A4R7SRN6_9BACT|nr:SprT family zinc-dependent metalloprotease [Prosthecobacter fusiformis]TDU81644.1 SprT-like family protein [Prosthecobacter fusiformis]
MSKPSILSQLFLDFQAGIRGSLAERALKRPLYAEAEAAPSKVKAKEKESAGNVADETLTETCRELLHQIDLAGAAKLVSVQWNSRLRSTAGYASFPAWKIELNPKLQEFEGQVERTMRHELAHLVAYHRAGRRRIEPHGAEWQQACADLGIPGESARHRLPLPRREVKRNYTYACAHCGLLVQRVRKFRRYSACSACCSKHSGGLYDSRFRFVLVQDLKKG